ncbi:MAG: hypothetical protein AAF433_16330 [Bacteroidota bacterium]
MAAKPSKTSWQDWLLFGHFWIALAAAGLAWTTAFLSHGKGQLSYLYLLILLGTLALYSWHRIFSFARKGAQTQRARYRLVANYPQLSRSLAVLASLSSLLLLFLLEEVPSPLVLSIGLIIGLGYVVPLGKNHNGLLRRSYFKPLVVAGGWTLITAYLPLHYAGELPTGFNLYLVLIERFLFSLTVALCFDWRDRKVDRQQGIKTLAQQPLSWSKTAAYISLGGAIACCLMLIKGEYWGLYAATMLFSYPIGFALIYFLGRWQSDYSFAWLYNGLLALPPFFIWCIIWIPWFKEFALSLIYMIRLL